MAIQRCTNNPLAGRSDAEKLFIAVSLGLVTAMVSVGGCMGIGGANSDADKSGADLDVFKIKDPSKSYKQWYDAGNQTLCQEVWSTKIKGNDSYEEYARRVVRYNNTSLKNQSPVVR